MTRAACRSGAGRDHRPDPGGHGGGAEQIAGAGGAHAKCKCGRRERRRSGSGSIAGRGFLRHGLTFAFRDPAAPSAASSPSVASSPSADFRELLASSEIFSLRLSPSSSAAFELSTFRGGFALLRIRVGLRVACRLQRRGFLGEASPETSRLGFSLRRKKEAAISAGRSRCGGRIRRGLLGGGAAGRRGWLAGAGASAVSAGAPFAAAAEMMAVDRARSKRHRGIGHDGGDCGRRRLGRCLGWQLRVRLRRPQQRFGRRRRFCGHFDRFNDADLPSMESSPSPDILSEVRLHPPPLAPQPDTSASVPSGIPASASSGDAEVAWLYFAKDSPGRISNGWDSVGGSSGRCGGGNRRSPWRPSPKSGRPRCRRRRPRRGSKGRRSCDSLGAGGAATGVGGATVAAGDSAGGGATGGTAYGGGGATSATTGGGGSVTAGAAGAAAQRGLLPAAQ